MEGSCNAMCEALALGTPVIATRISGLIGTLGEDYPGLFQPRDERELAELLLRAERDSAFLAELHDRCTEAAQVLTPSHEIEAWAAVLAELR